MDAKRPLDKRETRYSTENTSDWKFVERRFPEPDKHRVPRTHYGMTIRDDGSLHYIY